MKNELIKSERMPIGLYRVNGLSMSPGLAPGDYVVTLKRWKSRYRIGDIVVAQHPHFGRIIKRIRAIQPDGMLWLEGTHPDSTSTEKMGSISNAIILGRIINTTRNNNQINARKTSD
ncbi:nickel-type superoxide dismutase maturation protease [Cobetia sp. 29-18-1]|uniref:nickel-type superoxide dismutase maturation protease n=1 Tax=Cobetia sp. 29-18-1 TaxID=3040018 RepID=UPI00244C10AC|nr:nickel-type superoxide dismutase maturation protease [Cobetia sp. 29-18-1]MDH2298156.1 nickel-type superoxide dismutase maturation protease [Cobetia sp. 29-18-1]